MKLTLTDKTNIPGDDSFMKISISPNNEAKPDIGAIYLRLDQNGTLTIHVESYSYPISGRLDLEQYDRGGVVLRFVEE